MNNASILKLARSIYPDKQWYVDSERTVPVLKNGMYFYPPHFDCQFIDTLVWLIKTGCVSLHGECVVGKELHVDFPANGADPIIIKLDASAEGIKQAVYEAAIMVVNNDTVVAQAQSSSQEQE